MVVPMKYFLLNNWTWIWSSTDPTTYEQELQTWENKDKINKVLNVENFIGKKIPGSLKVNCKEKIHGEKSVDWNRLYNSPFLLPPATSNHHSTLLLYVWLCSIPHISGIMHDLFFCDWLMSLSLMSLRFIHAVA